MSNIPKKEQSKFESILYGQAKRFGMSPQEYLQKIWYHEEASKLGEYVAMLLSDQLQGFLPINEQSDSKLQPDS